MEWRMSLRLSLTQQFSHFPRDVFINRGLCLGVIEIHQRFCDCSRHDRMRPLTCGDDAGYRFFILNFSQSHCRCDFDHVVRGQESSSEQRDSPWILGRTQKHHFAWKSIYLFLCR